MEQKIITSLHSEDTYSYICKTGWAGKNSAGRTYVTAQQQLVQSCMWDFFFGGGGGGMCVSVGEGGMCFDQLHILSFNMSKKNIFISSLLFSICHIFAGRQGMVLVKAIVREWSGGEGG